MEAKKRRLHNIEVNKVGCRFDLKCGSPPCEVIVPIQIRPQRGMGRSNARRQGPYAVVSPKTSSV
jgi:hypothetical protein